MSRHQLLLEEIKFPIVIEQEMAGSYGEGSHKTLKMIVTIVEDNHMSSSVNYQVLQNNKVSETFVFLHNAVIAYNNLP